ncbi:hypothetical protein [Bosea minatitlanensis]|uniref:O-antigen ligase-like membrane protein n=1 Tax=Bosea minatitlanensis TaxID=128782 RepID=A0ABW0F3B2_9HYPH|nr:hypothetical protein [Bosea minatitlanensis]MCT4493940.1 hypothetical protein [Bosea minatitlanensis]
MSKAVTIAAKINLAALIVIFQSNFLYFFYGPLSSFSFWKLCYYSIWGVTVLVSLISIIERRHLARAVAPIANVLMLCALIIFIHPIDNISKSFLAGLCTFICVFVLASRAGAKWALSFSACVTAFAGGLCLMDAAFPALFGNTAGRASGFVGNANDAAMQLLLGLIVSVQALPRGLRASYVVWICAAIIATLSRSTMLVASIVLAISAARQPEVRAMVRNVAGARETRVIASVVVLWLAAAAIWNPFFGKGNDSIVDRIGQLPFALQSFLGSVRPMWDQQAENNSYPDGASNGDFKNLEQVDSAAARGIYLRRSISAYSSGPPTGIGLAEAYKLSSHNTYLLFGVAFSTIGFAIPIMIIFLIFAYSGFGLALPMTVCTLMLFSSNILFFPATMILLSLGMVGKQASISVSSSSAENRI